MAERLIYRRSQFEKDINEKKPLTSFQNEVYCFMVNRKFDEMWMDEYGVLIFYFELEPFSIQEFRDNTDTKKEWAEIQDKFNKGIW